MSIQVLWPVFVFFFSFRAAPLAYGSSQDRGQKSSELQLLAYATATAMLDLSLICDYTTAHGNARSLTHWVRPRINGSTVWILKIDTLGFTTHWATVGTAIFFFAFFYIECTNCLYILNISLLVISLENTFSHFAGYLFIVLMVSFAMQKLLSLIKPYFKISVFISFDLGD